MFDAQRQPSFIWLWVAIHGPCGKGAKISEVHIFAHPTCGLKIPSASSQRLSWPGYGFQYYVCCYALERITPSQLEAA